MNLDILPATQKVLESTKPTTLFLGGRGSSKTVSGALWTISKLIKRPGVVFGCFSPTHAQTSSVMLPNLTLWLDKMGIQWTFNKQPKFLKSRFQKHDNILSINLGGSQWASQCFLGTAETYDYARGREFFGLWIDEIRDCREEAIKVFLGCLRGFGDGVYPKLYTTTPNGFDYIYKEYIETKRDDVELITSASQDNIFLPQTFFDELKNNYSDNFYRQEVLGEIINFTVGQVVTSFDHQKHITKEGIEGEYFLSCDFNLLPMCWTYGKFNKNHIHTYGEIVMPDVSRTNEAFTKFICDFPEVKGKKLYIYGDASGKARTTKSNKTDYELIIEEAKKYGIRIVDKSLTKNPSHMDRINTYNNLLEKNCLTFDPSCEKLFEDFYNTVWKPGTREIWKSKWDPHTLDSSSYMIWSEYKPTNLKITMGRV